MTQFTTLVLRPIIGLRSPVPTCPQGKPCIVFLFVHSWFCRRLPSDLPSRTTPLSLTNVSNWLARSGFPPYRYMVCVAHKKELFHYETALLVQQIGILFNNKFV